MLRKLIHKYRLNKEIKKYAHIVNAEGVLLAQKIIERLSEKPSDSEMANFCDRVEQKWVKEQNYLLIEYKTFIEIGFEYSCYLLNSFDRSFSDKKWDGSFQILFNEILEIYTESFHDIYEFDTSANQKTELRKMLHHKMQMKLEAYSKTEWNEAADVCIDVIEKLNNELTKALILEGFDIKINQRKERARLFEHLMTSFCDEKGSNALIKIEKL
jgi:hypothetical protein